MILLDGQNLSLATLQAIANGTEQIQIKPLHIEKIKEAEKFVAKITKGKKAIYGINTGFGHLASVRIDIDKLEELQTNLLISHACGVGDILPIKTVRVMLALRINALIQGFSGLRYQVIEQMLLLLNHNIIPVVYEQGSLGASGDLALLSHMSLPLIGLGEVFYQDQKMSALVAYQASGLNPLPSLQPKEGLSLINGTQAMSAIGGLALVDAFRLLNLASLALALSMEALGGLLDAYDEKVHKLRRQDGQTLVARQVRSFLKNSLNITKTNEKKVQDAYSLRCAPQVHGAVLQALWHVKSILENEFNAVTDNPLVFAKEEEVISAGNFHGEPLALALDYLGIAASELASISERRIERLVNPQLNNGLPPFLTNSSGLNSGFMIVQYTAASLVSENKVLSHPASVDSIPSSANQEDHVSMGTTAARKARDIIKNAYQVIALEIFASTQALGFRGSEGLGLVTSKAYRLIKEKIPFITKDELMYPYIQELTKLIMSDDFYNSLFERTDIIE